VFFWTTILEPIATGFCLAAFTAPTLGRTLAAGAAGAAIALLLAFVIIVGMPFEGDTSAAPGAAKSADPQCQAAVNGQHRSSPAIRVLSSVMRFGNRVDLGAFNREISLDLRYGNQTSRYTFIV
jgi:hypothetical protein